MRPGRRGLSARRMGPNGARVTRLHVTDLPLDGVKRVERTVNGDTRGTFSRVFCADELASAGWEDPVAQVNVSETARRGTVRGLHYQLPPHAEMKLVTCLRGEVWDVAVDLRRGSPTFLRWHAETLSASNRFALLIPKGVAHGWQSLTDDVEILYCHSAPYAASAEGGVNPLDPRLQLVWPLPVAALSSRDAAYPLLSEDFTGVRV